MRVRRLLRDRADEAPCDRSRREHLPVSLQARGDALEAADVGPLPEEGRCGDACEPAHDRAAEEGAHLAGRAGEEATAASLVWWLDESALRRDAHAEPWN